ncbi:NifU family protein [Aureivirga marina]|uniref:NifU family protein n=1 Tax=Aureivirga marina TaxID=1182451 RepID=UPI0018CBBC01|nr:NifU family protein [Aureivirga marina]
METSNELRLNVEKALEEIRPFLVTDGGDITLISIEDNIVKVRLEGACTNCSVNQMTLKNGVEATIKRYAPEIKEVVEVR